MRYLWGPTGIVARQTSGGTAAWYLADALGTVRDVINNSGTVIDHVDYSAFGTVLDESSPANGDRFVSFARLERDTVTGLNLAVEREENPGTGRWDSQDPLGFAAADPDLYRYAGNSPTVLQDPVGTVDNTLLVMLLLQSGTLFPPGRDRPQRPERRILGPPRNPDLVQTPVNRIPTFGPPHTGFPTQRRPDLPNRNFPGTLGTKFPLPTVRPNGEPDFPPGRPNPNILPGRKSVSIDCPTENPSLRGPYRRQPVTVNPVVPRTGSGASPE
jgi:RHS repeat-associated protein